MYLHLMSHLGLLIHLTFSNASAFKMIGFSPVSAVVEFHEDCCPGEVSLARRETIVFNYHENKRALRDERLGRKKEKKEKEGPTKHERVVHRYTTVPFDTLVDDHHEALKCVDKFRRQLAMGHEAVSNAQPEDPRRSLLLDYMEEINERLATAESDVHRAETLVSRGAAVQLAPADHLAVLLDKISL
ncbi:hypothetical protein ACMFMG_007834 [Clarireedia jacksonii]